MPWFKKQALSGEWTAYIEAQSESDVQAMHAMDQALPASMRRYPGPCNIEQMEPDFELPCYREAQYNRESLPNREEQPRKPVRRQQSKERLVLLFSVLGLAGYKR